MVDASLRATILESLMKLKRELGISLVYITHDLTTAYQISENIYILYRGSVAEVGSVEQGHQRSATPLYAPAGQFDSLARPRHPLGGETDIEKKATAAGVAAVGHGCKFSDRCPFVMAECREKAPPLTKPILIAP